MIATKFDVYSIVSIFSSNIKCLNNKIVENIMRNTKEIYIFSLLDIWACFGKTSASTWAQE